VAKPPATRAIRMVVVAKPPAARAIHVVVVARPPAARAIRVVVVARPPAARAIRVVVVAKPPAAPAIRVVVVAEPPAARAVRLVLRAGRTFRQLRQAFAYTLALISSTNRLLARFTRAERNAAVTLKTIPSATHAAHLASPEVREAIQAVLKRRAVPEADLEDLTHDVIERALVAPSTAATLEQCKAIVTKVANDLAIDSWRRARRRSKVNVASTRTPMTAPDAPRARATRSMRASRSRSCKGRSTRARLPVARPSSSRATRKRCRTARSRASCGSPTRPCATSSPSVAAQYARRGRPTPPSACSRA
jgi:hypothetical protein